MANKLTEFKNLKDMTLAELLVIVGDFSSLSKERAESLINWILNSPNIDPSKLTARLLSVLLEKIQNAGIDLSQISHRQLELLLKRLADENKAVEFAMIEKLTIERIQAIWNEVLMSAQMRESTTQISEILFNLSAEYKKEQEKAKEKAEAEAEKSQENRLFNQEGEKQKKNQEQETALEKSNK